MALELPDKFMRRDALMNMGNMSIYRTSGFNGDGLINEIDQPPQLAGGGMIQMRVAGPGGRDGGPGGTAPTPEQQAAMKKTMIANNKTELTRLVLGMFAQGLSSFPVTFTHGGQAESADGKADIIDVKGEGEFAARLFIDTQTHLPLMLSWMAKEPLVMTRGGSTATSGGGNTFIVAGGGGPVVSHGGHSAAAPPPPPPPPPPGGPVTQRPNPNMTPEEREKAIKEMQEQMKIAEANRKVVEYRLFYSDYKEVDGLTLPHKFQRSIAGKPTEEVFFDKVKINPKIDAKKFEVTKDKS
jgi:hypothetical protein